MVAPPHRQTTATGLRRVLLRNSVMAGHWVSDQRGFNEDQSPVASALSVVNVAASHWFHYRYRAHRGDASTRDSGGTAIERVRPRCW